MREKGGRGGGHKDEEDDDDKDDEEDEDEDEVEDEEASWVHRGSFLGCLGAARGPLGGFSGASWRPFEPSWRPLGGVLGRCGLS